MAWLVAGVVVMAVSAATSAYASYESGVQQKKAADFNSQMAQYNADQAKQAATAKAEIYQRQANQAMGAMRQRFAASGVDLGPGTPLMVLMDSASAAAKDVVRIKAGGDASSWSFLSESALQSSIGQSAMTQGTIGAGASLLGGAAKAFSMYSAGTKKAAAPTGPGVGD